ncbi:Panacea domain-containing protein [Pseudomonas pergaminensis]
MPAPYSAKAVANTILRMAWARGINDVSPMKLQKLVYYAHAWYLVFLGEPLVRDEIQAWKFGPVIPELYYAFNDYGNMPIVSEVSELDFNNSDLVMIVPEVSEADSQTLGIISETLRVYGGYDPVQLSNLSHMDKEPWKVIADRYRNELPHGLEMPNNLIRECFVRIQQEAVNG